MCLDCISLPECKLGLVDSESTRFVDLICYWIFMSLGQSWFRHHNIFASTKNYSFGYFIEQICSLFKLPCRHNHISLCSKTNNSLHPFHPTFSGNPVHPHFTYISRKWLQLKTPGTRVFSPEPTKFSLPRLASNKMTFYLII